MNLKASKIKGSPVTAHSAVAASTSCCRARSRKAPNINGSVPQQSLQVGSLPGRQVGSLQNALAAHPDPQLEARGKRSVGERTHQKACSRKANHMDEQHDQPVDTAPPRRVAAHLGGSYISNDNKQFAVAGGSAAKVSPQPPTWLLNDVPKRRGGLARAAHSQSQSLPAQCDKKKPEQLCSSQQAFKSQSVHDAYTKTPQMRPQKQTGTAASSVCTSKWALRYPQTRFNPKKLKAGTPGASPCQLALCQVADSESSMLQTWLINSASSGACRQVVRHLRNMLLEARKACCKTPVLWMVPATSLKSELQEVARFVQQQARCQQLQTDIDELDDHIEGLRTRSAAVDDAAMFSYVNAGFRACHSSVSRSATIQKLTNEVSKMMHAVQALHAVGGSVMDSEGTPAKPRALLDVW